MVQEFYSTRSAGAETTLRNLEQPTPLLDTRTLTAIQNTIYTCECSGKCNQTTRERHKKRLLKLAQQTDLFNSQQVAHYILNLKRSPHPTAKNKPKNTNKQNKTRQFKDNH